MTERERKRLLTPFGLWLFGWRVRFRRWGWYGLERGWSLEFGNGHHIASFLATPDFDMWGHRLIFWGHRITVRAMGIPIRRTWRGRVIVSRHG